MKNLFTTINITPSTIKINHKQNILMIGSCFVEEIGKKFGTMGFSTLINPFGILYNPLSIAECLKRIAKKEFFETKDLIYNNEYYYLFATHGDYRHKEKENLLSIINNEIEEAHSFLAKTDHI
ncbi:MAG: GSCFA domain-containing protein, partial [Bacteroidota bacterium]|nr:GSCFA domain-containing protein [Bacteroidota bacterium]